MVQNKVLTGNVAISVVGVSGKSHCVLSEEAWALVTIQVKKALAIITSAGPDNLRFKCNFNLCTVDETRSEVMSFAARSIDEIDDLESRWILPALKTLGFYSHNAYLMEQLLQSGCDQGFVVYISKFPMEHFAYQTNSRICLSYFSGGFGIANLHALLLHEICHVFGAADEVGACHCNEKFGVAQIKNGNCHSCSPNPVPCIMAANSLDICLWTRRQIGWQE